MYILYTGGLGILIFISSCRILANINKYLSCPFTNRLFSRNIFKSARKYETQGLYMSVATNKSINSFTPKGSLFDE